MRTSNITKKQIIKACANVIDRIGLENTTVDDVAKEAGIAKGSIYVYFKKKDAIFSEAIKFLAQERIDVLKKVLLKYETYTDKLNALLSANSYIAKTDPESFQMNYSLLLSSHKELKKESGIKYFESYLKLVEEIYRKGIDTGEFIDIDPKLAAFIIVSSSDLGAILNHLNKKSINTKMLQTTLLNFIKNKNGKNM